LCCKDPYHPVPVIFQKPRPDRIARRPIVGIMGEPVDFDCEPQ
jgi:hypothetical protein